MNRCVGKSLFVFSRGGFFVFRRFFLVSAVVGLGIVVVRALGTDVKRPAKTGGM